MYLFDNRLHYIFVKTRFGEGSVMLDCLPVRPAVVCQKILDDLVQ